MKHVGRVGSSSDPDLPAHVSGTVDVERRHRRHRAKAWPDTDVAACGRRVVDVTRTKGGPLGSQSAAEGEKRESRHQTPDVLARQHDASPHVCDTCEPFPEELFYRAPTRSS